ncbi:8100_t:CDS:1, partial [Funneliformis mosseae]
QSWHTNLNRILSTRHYPTEMIFYRLHNQEISNLIYAYEDEIIIQFSRKLCRGKSEKCIALNNVPT